MARHFENAAADKVHKTTAIITGYPWTISGWFLIDAAPAGFLSLFNIGESGFTDYWGLWVDGAAAGDPIEIFTDDGAGASSATSTTGTTAGTWHHFTVTASGATNRTVYLDGGSSATDSTSRSPSGMTFTSLGNTGWSGFEDPFDGRLAEFVFRNVALSAAEVALLANGVNPFDLRPGTITGYAPIYGVSSPEPDFVSAVGWTVDSAPPVSAHPPLARSGIPMIVGTSFIPAGTDTTITPPQGNLTLSATAPARLTASNRLPSAGDLALSSTAPSRVTGSNRLPAAGDLTLSSTAPTVQVGGDKVISPPQANLVLSATAPARVLASNRLPAQADLALSSTAPSRVTDSARAVPQANLALSATAPARQTASNRLPAAANLTLSSTAPTVDVSGGIVVPQGDLTLSTTAPTRTVDHIRVVPQANLTLSGTAPTIGQGISISPPSANLTLSATAPARVNASQRLPAAGNLTLSTTAPTVGGDRTISPATAQLVLSSTAPQVTSSNLIAIGETTWTPAFHSRTWDVAYHSRTWTVDR